MVFGFHGRGRVDSLEGVVFWGRRTEESGAGDSGKAGKGERFRDLLLQPPPSSLAGALCPQLLFVSGLLLISNRTRD